MTAKIPSLIAASVAALTIASAASAAGADDFSSVRVRYADLNLSNEAGAAHLYARLRNAANQVCEYTSFRNVVDQGCAATALNGAVTAVGNARLTALHLRAAGATQGVPDAR